MRNYVTYNNKRWELIKNGSKGVILVRNSPTQMLHIDCMPNETPDQLFNIWYDMFGDKINA